MDTHKRGYRSSRPSRPPPMGRRQRNPGQEPRHGADSLRASGNTSEGASEIQEGTTQSVGRPTLPGQAQATQVPPQAPAVKDPSGPAPGPATAPEPPQEARTSQAGEAGTRAEAPQGARAKSTSKVAGATSLSKEDWRQIEAALKELEIGPENRDHAVILMAALVVGANADTVAKATGLNRDKVVRPIAKRLRDNGVWRNGVTYCQWLDGPPEEGATAFLCDVLVAEGRVRRVSTNDEVKWANEDGTPHTGKGQTTA